MEEIHGKDVMSSSLSDMNIQQLLQQIPDFIKSIIIEGKTEEEVAQKWKMTRESAMGRLGGRKDGLDNCFSHRGLFPRACGRF